MSEVKSEYRNDSEHQVGYLYYDEDNKRQGGAVRPGETVWLSERDKIATANAPARDEDNPLANGDLTLVTAAKDLPSRRPLGPTEVATPVEPSKEEAPAVENDEQPEDEAEEGTAKSEPKAKKATKNVPTETADVRPEQSKPAEETGAAKAPKGKAPQGKRAAAEEVATPDAPAQG